MKKIYILAILVAGALATTTSCKKDKEDCFSVCGQEICESDYEKDLKEAEARGEKDSETLTWAKYKAFMTAFASLVDCDEKK